jgi:hypothetical protein
MMMLLAALFIGVSGGQDCFFEKLHVETLRV